MTQPSSSSLCKPRWATPRSHERESFGPAIAAVAEQLGQPLMPWQRLVADVGGELDPATGLPAYREVILTVPRQSGKTTLVLSWEVQRALGWGSPQKILYSAQTGADARKKLVEDQFPILAPRMKRLGIQSLPRANGNEGVVWKNGSRLILMASGEDAGHGKTIDLGIKDEFFADWDNRRDQALIPAMATRAAAQVLTLSTAGTDQSVPYNEAVERGRRAVDDGVRSGIAYFEWSASPDDDPDDPEVWRRCMPALGHTINEAVVRHARQTLVDSEFRRAFLNIPTKADDRVIPAAAWDAVCDPDVSPVGALVFSLDVNPERSAAAIVAASRGERPVCELVEHRQGIGWLLERAAELDRRWSSPVWVVDGSGPARSLVADMERLGLTVKVLSPGEVIEACAGFFDGVVDGSLSVRTHPKLNDAVAGAAKRTVGDAWAWTRRHASADVTPLVAATCAVREARGGVEPSVRFL